MAILAGWAHNATIRHIEFILFLMHCDLSNIIKVSVLAVLSLPAITSGGQTDAGILGHTKNIVLPVTVTSDIISLIPIGGEVAAQSSVVLAAQLPGRVVSISGKEGDFFQGGAVLLKLDDQELLAQRRAAVAQWASADAALRNSTVQYNQRLTSPGSTSQIPGGMGMPGMFDQIFINPMSSMMGTRHPGAERGAGLYASGTQISQAAHALEQARANIEQIDTKLRDSISVAPFDGVIVDKYVEEGDTVQPGQALLGFEDVGRQQIVADVSIKLAHTLKENDRLRAHIDANDITTEVQVDNIFPKADPTMHTVTVKFNLPETVKIASGAYAEVFIPNPSAKKGMVLITVPKTAIVQRGGLPVVFVVDDSGKARMKLVRLGGNHQNGETIIEYGLSEGDLIVDRPAAYLISGEKLPVAN